MGVKRKQYFTLKKITMKFKFRVWDECHEEMNYNPTVSLISTASINEWFEANEHCMVWLGITDTKGIDVYQTDIVSVKKKDGNWIKAVIDITNYGIIFCEFKKSVMGRVVNLEDLEGFPYTYLEVFSNIYEHDSKRNK